MLREHNGYTIALRTGLEGWCIHFRHFSDPAEKYSGVKVWEVKLYSTQGP